eukprot:g1757.t1
MWWHFINAILCVCIAACRYQVDAEIVTVNLTVEAIRYKNEMMEFNTRAYNKKIPGPLIRVRRGDTLVVNLSNRLKGNRTDGPDNWFKLPNTTNIHMHGLHVSPKQADNVFAEIGPGESRAYRYEIPEDHPFGTFWYHPHVHGSSSLQQSGGMAGVIIVDPGEKENIPADLAAMEEEVLLFQHLCFRDLGKFQSSAPYINHMELSKYGLDLLSPDPTFKYTNTTQDFYVVNGEFLPNVTLAPGEFKRFRLVAGGTQAFLELVLEDSSGNLATQSCEMYVIAKDGYFVDKPYRVEYPLLVPGSRIDLAVRCSNVGSYRFASRPGVAPYHSQLAQTTVVFDGALFYLNVQGNPRVMNLPNVLPTRPSYMPDLQEANVSSSFAWSFHTIGGPFKPGFPFPQHQINGKAFAGPDVFAANATLNHVQEWTIQIEGDSDVGAGNHPFHAHVNPFQVVAVGSGGSTASMFGVRVGEYRDTVPLSQSVPYTVRFVPDRFEGRALVHCHMIPHVDLGMAAVLRITPNMTV